MDISAEWRAQTRPFVPRGGRFLCSGGFLGARTRIPDGLRPQRSRQALADEVQISQGTGHEQPMGVLLKTTVTDLGEVEEALDDPEGVLDAAAGLGLYAVAGTLGLVDDALVASAAIREVTGLRGVFLEDIGLTLVGGVSPDLGLPAMEEIGQDRGVMDIGGGGHNGMDDLRLCCRRLYEPSCRSTTGSPCASGACPGRACPLCSWSTKAR